MFFLGRTIEVEEELFKRKGEGKKKIVEAYIIEFSQSNTISAKMCAEN